MILLTKVLAIAPLVCNTSLLFYLLGDIAIFFADYDYTHIVKWLRKYTGKWLILDMIIEIICYSLLHAMDLAMLFFSIGHMNIVKINYYPLLILIPVLIGYLLPIFKLIPNTSAYIYYSIFLQLLVIHAIYNDELHLLMIVASDLLIVSGIKQLAFLTWPLYYIAVVMHYAKYNYNILIEETFIYYN
jgi:hypothetical protein